MSSTTTDLGLYKPAAGEDGWDDEVNANFDTIDSQLATKEFVQDIAGGSAEFLFTPTVSDIGGIYYDMTIAAPAAAVTNIDTGNIASSTTTGIANFVTSIVETPASISPGVLATHVHALRVSGTRTLTLYWTAHVRSAGGADGAAFATSEVSPNLTAAETEYELSAPLIASQAFGTDERLVIKLFLVSTGGSGNTVGRIRVAGTTVSHFTGGVAVSAFSGLYASVVNGGLEDVGAVGNTGTDETIVLTTGNIQTYTVNGNCTFTMPSGLTSGKGISFTAILTDSGGPRNIAFTGVKWSGGTDPTVMSGAGAIDIFTFLTIDGGTTWYGFTGGTGMAT